jgi:hypothetical protein
MNWKETIKSVNGKLQNYLKKSEENKIIKNNIYNKIGWNVWKIQLNVIL